MRRKTRSSSSRLRRFSKRSLVTLLVLGFVYAALPNLAAAVRPDACRKWERRYVPGARWWVHDLDGDDLVDLRRETTVVHVPSYTAVWPRDGIALPGLVAISDKRVITGSDDLLWHELVHQHQYRRDGVAPFFLRYVADWHRGLLNGCDHNTAYLAIGYEIETEALLRKIRVDLGGVHSDDFERIALMLEDPSLRIPRVRPRLYSRPLNTVPPVPEVFERPSPPSTFEVSSPPPPVVRNSE